MSDIISHRGPDDSGYLFLETDGHYFTAKDNFIKSTTPGKLPYAPQVSVDDLSDHQFQIGLGHRRLSIIDVSEAGHNPMSYQNNRYWIVFNGEIYNYLELRLELEKHGHQFSSKTDTEVILAAFAEWGPECLSRFVGMWAFVIFDRNTNKVFVSRDRFGIKPLYYWVSDNGTLYFASEIKQFTVVDEWKQAYLNPQRVQDFLLYSTTDHTCETMFYGVHQLMPGTYYHASVDVLYPANKPIPMVKWYQMPPKTKFKGTFEDASEEFRNLFFQSINLHLRSDVPVGTALSGGLDSSAIVCVMNKTLNKEKATDLQKAFSSCSIYPRYDEKKWMDEVINHTNVEAHFVYPSPDNLFEITSDLIWYQDEPYQSQSAFLGYHVFESARKNGVKVLLNGQGADEYMGGYGQFSFPVYIEYLKKLKWRKLYALIKKEQSDNPVSFPYFVKGILYRLLPMVSKWSNRKQSTSSLFDFSRLGSDAAKHPYSTIPVSLNTILETVEHFTFFSSLPKYLRWEDRNSMAHSIEARVPFLDHRLFEFCLSLPYEFLQYNHQRKGIMRHALSGLIPDKIRDRKDKMGFATPEENWLKVEIPEVFKAKMREAIENTDGIIKKEVIAYLDDIIDERVPYNPIYWRIILFSEWMKRFNIKRLPE